MLQRKRGVRAGGPWCAEVAAQSPEGEGSAFRGGKRVIRRGGSKKKAGWAEKADEADNANNASSPKRVMVVVDHSQESKLALKWALSHVVHQLDVLVLLHVQPAVIHRQSCTSHGGFFSAKAAEEQRRKNEMSAWDITNSFKTIVASSRPENKLEPDFRQHPVGYPFSEILLRAITGGGRNSGRGGREGSDNRGTNEEAGSVYTSLGPTEAFHLVEDDEEEDRELGGFLHQQFGMFNPCGEKEEQEAGGLPHQQPVAEEFLAPGLTTSQFYDHSYPL